MEQQQGITFVTIPAEVFASKELTPGEKILYGWLSLFKKQCCFQSNESIAEATGLGERTISRGLEKLTEMRYIFIEYVNGNHAQRRIYTLFDNPKKLAYLARKGAFGARQDSFPQSFPQEKTTEVEGRQNGERVRQNGEEVRQNGEPHNGGEVRQNGDHKIRKYNQNIAEVEPSGSAGVVPAGRLDLKHDDFVSDDDYERAFYERNTVKLPA